MSSETGYRERVVAEGQRAHRWWFWPVALLILIVSIALIAMALSGRWPGSWTRGPQTVHTSFPPGALDHYVPANTAAVMQINLEQMRSSPIGQHQLKASLQQIVDGAENHYPWPGPTGVHPQTDLTQVQLFFAPGKNTQPLWLAHGKIDPGHFEVGPGKMQKKIEDGFEIYEIPSGMTLSPVDGKLLISQDRPAVLTALRHAVDAKPSAPADQTLRDMLQRVDRGLSFWIAADFKKLGSVGRIHNKGLEMVLRPVLDNAETVYGGLMLADDFRADFHFHSASDESARKLEGVLTSICGICRGLTEFSFGVDKELMPFFRLLATGQVHRDGTAITFQCRLPADQAGR
jgi:hypothetical protein